jgi:hypothetical protein
MRMLVRFMQFLLAIALGTVGASHAGADPDSYRKAPEGQQVFVSAEATEVGGVYEAFLIRFKDRDTAFLSPSRFRVAYAEGVLQCRNQEQFAVPESQLGQWHKISFEVLALRETAIEEPEGSGNWVWRSTIDCRIVSLALP